MARPPISTVELSDTLDLHECHPTSERHGPWWLWDYTRGMHLSMGAATERAALVEALTYYQERLTKVEAAHKTLSKQVDDFIKTINETEEE